MFQETLAFPQAVTRRELRYVSYLEVCPFAVMLCLPELKKGHIFALGGRGENNVLPWCWGSEQAEKSVFSERDRNPRRRHATVQLYTWGCTKEDQPEHQVQVYAPKLIGVII